MILIHWVFFWSTVINGVIKEIKWLKANGYCKNRHLGFLWLKEKFPRVSLVFVKLSVHSLLHDKNNTNYPYGWGKLN